MVFIKDLSPSAHCIKTLISSEWRIPFPEDLEHENKHLLPIYHYLEKKKQI
jgi:hypothetical protein